MLDINLLRTDKGGDPEIVRESQRRRYKRVEDVDDVIAMDAKWRDARYELDNLNQEFNKANKEVAKLKVAKEDADAAMARVKEIDARRTQVEAEEKSLEEETNKLLLKLGNLVHSSVPVNDNEDFNTVYRTWGLDTKRMEDGLPNHVDLVAMLDIADLERGTDVAGARGYFLKGAGVLLNQAMINYAITFLAQRGHTPLATPFFMRKDRMAECAQLADFDEQLYKVSGEGEDKYLIATSEQTCCSYLRKRWIMPKELPMRFAGYSTCFRKEAGSHGRDTLGIFRVHQFEKIEQFVATSPDGDDSWEEMERLIGNSEAFYQSLGLPYHVVDIVSGALNDAAAKKYDLEAWFPASKTFRELVSCSNCLDYQSRRLEVRCGAPQKGPEKKKSYVHLLNSTLTATERTLCCLMENWQTPEGMVVPPALRPWMMGIDFIPFVRKLDKKGKLVDVVPPPPLLYGPAAAAAAAAPPQTRLGVFAAMSAALALLPSLTSRFLHRSSSRRDGGEETQAQAQAQAQARELPMLHGAFSMALATGALSTAMSDVSGNLVFMCSFWSWLAAQVMKVFTAAYREGRWDYRVMFDSGGMPSSHTSLVVGLTTGIAYQHGLGSPLFPLSLAFSLVVMYDATGVRRHAGKQAEVLNKILDDLFHGQLISEKKLKEVLGHSPLQVLAGAVLGVFVGIVYMYKFGKGYGVGA